MSSLFLSEGVNADILLGAQRTFLKTRGRNIPIQAIGLSLYEQLGAVDGSSTIADEEKIGTEVVRTQWLDLSTLGEAPLIGRRILIVDEVDVSLLYNRVL